MEQLALAFDAPSPTEDADDPIGRTLRQHAAYAAPRTRQGVGGTRYAADRAMLLDATVELRRRAEDGDASAALDACALLTGLGDTVVRGVSIGGAPDACSATVHLDLESGCVWTDQARITLGQAARPRDAQAVEPATHWIGRPMPAWLLAVLQVARERRPWARRLGELLDARARRRGESLLSGGSGRLRPTLPRLQLGLLAHLRADLALDAHLVQALTNRFVLARSRLYYLRIDAVALHAAASAMHASLGWGPTVAPAISPAAGVGSMVVPTRAALQAAWQERCDEVGARKPARRCQAAALVDHHNAYACAAAWMLVFLTGAREQQQIGFSAASFTPSACFAVLADKATGPSGSPRPVLLTAPAREQLRLHRVHLQALVSRAERLGVDRPWLDHARAAAAGADVALFFSVDGRGRAKSLSTAEVVPALSGLVPNMGRHYWQTELHLAGVDARAIDQFARHAASGIESLTSTSLMSLRDALEEVDRVQQAVLAQMGLSPLAGLGRWSVQ